MTKKISKSTLSMFLRTRCDKELYLSLHDKRTMGEEGLPKPIKRPGIGILSTQGKEFEIERNDQLVRLFPDIVHCTRNNNSYGNVNLETVLLNINNAPALVLQGEFSISCCRTEALQNIGLSPCDIATVPNIANFIPDILIIREPRSEDIVINPDGSREEIANLTRKNFVVEIIDIKHTSEANPSYCAEIAMYALMLANWLAHHLVLREHFYVTTNAYLWTRFKQGDSKLSQLESAGGATTEQLLEALTTDSEDANLRFYLAAVRRFFEDVVRVIRIGESAPRAWINLEWHVNSTCSSCDWLGDKRHLGSSQKEIVEANPMYYCMPAAKESGHLSLVPGITRGAKKILETNLVQTTTDLSNADNHPAFQQHTVLKRDARHLPARSAAIISGNLSSDPNATIASLVSNANLLLYASVNFDSSAGLLTGLALSGVATNFQPGQSPVRFRAMPYLVDQKTLDAEWVALEAFLSQIADCITTAENLVQGNSTGQIHFWEERQFKELCNAMGRHLPRVLALTTKRVRALAWVFPPDDLIARPESLESSTVVTVDEIVRRMVFTPTPHTITLFDTVEHYSSSRDFIPTVRDSYYREFLSSGIPRERIYEIWSNATQVKRGATIIPRNTVITEYSNALARQSQALASICDRLRQDYRGHFKTNATRIPSSIPQGARNVAFDGKLWIWWDNLEFNASRLESHIRLSLEGERLEASYEAIILRNGRFISPGQYEFDVASGSTEAKFKEDSMLTLGKIGRPGMPLERATTLLQTAQPFPGNQHLLQLPLWSGIRARLVSFDRINARAVVELVSSDPQFIPYLIANSSIDLLTDVFLLETNKPSAFNWGNTSADILQEIGTPSIAIPDQNAANAMGITPSARQRRNAPVTPVARLLWEASALEQAIVTSGGGAQRVASYVSELYRLNPSQTLAVEHAVERALTVIWGPPGTGKTNTLAALIHGLIQEAHAQQKPLNILVTGPTYKAVEEVMHRAAATISRDSTAAGFMYLGYSSTRLRGPLPTGLAKHVSYKTFHIDQQDLDYQECCGKLLSGLDIVILGCQIRQARRFPQTLMNAYVCSLFDVVIIDESSQVPVSQSLSALCGLRVDSRVIIAGDHLQMPPIFSIEPPSDAAYLVGSIQSYLLKRNFQNQVNQCILETNYRSNEEIVAFARKIGYPSLLQAGFPSTALHLLNPLPSQSEYPVTLPWCAAFPELMMPDHKVVTLLHEDEVSSQGNHFEARVVAGIVWMLRQCVSVALDGREPVTHTPPIPSEFWNQCVGVVTPHRAQRALVIRELERLFPGEKNLIDESVDTVERFQGGERHAIIVTFGVADTDVISGEEAFLMQLERTNVAVSRAMAKSIVVMPKSLAAHIPEDKKALDTAFALKEYIEEFCNVRVTTTLSDELHTRWAQVRYHSR